MHTARRWTLRALILAALAVTPLAWAQSFGRPAVSLVTLLGQHTGGSFGGSSWGGGGSSGSSGSSSSSDHSSSSGGSYGGSSSEGGWGLLGLGFLFLVFYVYGEVAARVRRFRNPGGVVATGVDAHAFVKLSIAFESRVREAVQAKMERLAARVDLTTSDGLQRAAQSMAATLGRFLDGAYLTHVEHAEGLSMDSVRYRFQQAVDAERGRFVVETVRADAAGLRNVDAPASSPSSEEGGGFVVVTVVVARRGGVAGFRPIASRDDLAHDLQVALTSSGVIQALEVVWQPSDPNDVMSSAEMATVFPALKPLSPDAKVGRRACASCKSVYAAELAQCPNCGAPAEAAPPPVAG